MHDVEYKFKDGIEEPKHYYGYVYEVKIHSGKSRHKYGGGKKGKFIKRIKYYGSVVTHLEEYERDFYNNKVTITIIMFLTKCEDDIWRAEHRYLTMVKAKDNLEYFNETNGGSKVNKKDDDVLELKKKVDKVGKGEEVDGIELLDSNVEYISSLSPFQPRLVEFVPGKKKEIARNIDEFGDTKLKEVLPVPAFRDYDGKGKHKRCGHNHVLGAVGLTKKYKFELIEKIVVKLEKRYRNKSFVVADGKFVCLDPYLGTNYHLLSDVLHSKLEIKEGYYPKFNNLKKKFVNNKSLNIQKNSEFKNFINHSSQYLPFLKNAKFIKSFFIVRTLKRNVEKTDERTTEFTKIDDKFYNILSSKWNTCVTLSRKIEKNLDL